MNRLNREAKLLSANPCPPFAGVDPAELHNLLLRGRALRAVQLSELVNAWFTAPHVSLAARIEFVRVVERVGLCWIMISGDGEYSEFRAPGWNRAVAGHRWSFMAVHAWIPEDRVVHHLCENKRCVNPDHLRLLTIGDNVRASVRPTPKVV
jgi:hypothetical protein